MAVQQKVNELLKFLVQMLQEDLERGAEPLFQTIVQIFWMNLLIWKQSSGF